LTGTAHAANDARSNSQEPPGPVRAEITPDRAACTSVERDAPVNTLAVADDTHPIAGSINDNRDQPA
jgi:hypothetical protein